MSDTLFTDEHTLSATSLHVGDEAVLVSDVKRLESQFITCQATLERERQQYAKLQLRVIDMEKQLAKVDELHSKLAIAESKADKMVYLEDDLEERNITIEKLKMTIDEMTSTIDTLAIRIARLIEVGK